MVWMDLFSFPRRWRTAWLGWWLAGQILFEGEAVHACMLEILHLKPLVWERKEAGNSGAVTRWEAAAAGWGGPLPSVARGGGLRHYQLLYSSIPQPGKRLALTFPRLRRTLPFNRLVAGEAGGGRRLCGNGVFPSLYS